MIRKVDPDTGAQLHTIQSNRFVTSGTWTDGKLWLDARGGCKKAPRRLDVHIGEAVEGDVSSAGMTMSGLGQAK